jgi:hypothetical protein
VNSLRDIFFAMPTAAYLFIAFKRVLGLGIGLSLGGVSGLPFVIDLESQNCWLPQWGCLAAGVGKLTGVTGRG